MSGKSMPLKRYSYCFTRVKPYGLIVTLENQVIKLKDEFYRRSLQRKDLSK